MAPLNRRWSLPASAAGFVIYPLLQQNIIPVVTGFIGATTDGVLTTLGRGGSDYSATILAAALGAQEVIIWTDVDGVLTGDPRHVSDATSIPELSYGEATELAHFGAKVLHPKTMNPVMQLGIPIGIRNTFAPHRLGTRVSAFPTPSDVGFRAVTALRNVAVIKLVGTGLTNDRNVLGRSLSTLASVHAELLMVSCLSAQHEFSFVVPATVAKAATEALTAEFSTGLTDESKAQFTLDTNVSLIAVVGERLPELPEVFERMTRVLGQEKIEILAMAQRSSSSSLTFLIHETDTKAALDAAHREFCRHSANAGFRHADIARRETPIPVRDHRLAKRAPSLHKPNRKSAIP